jgi:hypothetical protein
MPHQRVLDALHADRGLGLHVDRGAGPESSQGSDNIDTLDGTIFFGQRQLNTVSIARSY